MESGGSKKMKYRIKNSNVCLHPAAPGDCELVLSWRNLPEIVHLSSSRKVVSLAEHKKWFNSVLNDKKKLIFLIKVKSSPIGLLRFEINNSNEAEISIYLIPGKTGHGFGVSAIKKGCNHLFSLGKIHKVVAKIRNDNERSIKAFSKCGFKLTSRSKAQKNHILLVKVLVANKK